VLSVGLSGPQTAWCGTSPVVIDVTIGGGEPDSVELLEDGQPVAQLAAPFQYRFDCAAKAERTYVLSARASLQGTSFSSSPKQLVVDRTRPTITSGPFSALDTEISTHTPIRVTFSEPLRSSRVTANSVALVSATKSLSWSEDQIVLTVTPLEPIVAPRNLGLLLYPQDFEDLAGNPLVADNPTQWTWTVPVFLHTWTLPKYGNGVSAAAPPAFAQDSEGRSIVAWFEYTQAGGAADVYVHRSAGSGSTPLGGALSALPGSSWVEEVAVAADASNRPVVAWTERASTDLQVFVRRWNGTSWEELAGVPNPIPSADATQLTLATGHSDLPVVAWRELDASQKARVYVYRWDGSRWDPVSSPLAARTPSASVGFPSLAVDKEDRPVVSVTEQSSDTAFLESAVVWRLEGAIWKQVGSAIRPESASASAYVNRTSLSLDAQGRPALAFELLTPGTLASDVYFARDGDAGWSSPLKLGGPDAEAPSLGFDAQGSPWASWQTGPQATGRSIVLREAVEAAPESSLEHASHPVFANGGVGAPVVLIVDEDQRVPRVITRQ
jgi:hypothetical protein